MIKKIILKRATQAILNKSKLRKFIGRGGKITKIKAQESIPVFKHADQEIARKSFKKTFGKLKEHESINIADATELAAKELANTTANVKWTKQINKFVTRKRSTLASRVKTWRNKNLASGQVNPVAFKVREASANYPLVKRSVKKAKIKAYNKALGAADTKAKSVYQKTHLLFTGKSGADPLKHKLVETKFITTKKFRKGKMDDWSESMMPGKGFHGESFAKLKGAAWHEHKRRSDWFKKPEVIEALAKGKTTKSKVYGAWLKDEAKRRREFAQSFIKTTKKKK
jgi:hypothetical protein